MYNIIIIIICLFVLRILLHMNTKMSFCAKYRAGSSTTLNLIRGTKKNKIFNQLNMKSSTTTTICRGILIRARVFSVFRPYQYQHVRTITKHRYVLVHIIRTFVVSEQVRYKTFYLVRLIAISKQWK